ncbi:MAG: antirestriction protein ArdA [Oscillospiraceae bacterium]|nr:antirestriction protein ArdA [Oscillospiraceae bacterium]
MNRISIFLTNLGRYEEGCLMGEWVKLPVPKDELENVLRRIGINERYEEYFISDYESLFPNLYISEYASIAELNELAQRVDELADYDYEKLAAVLEYESSMSIEKMLEIIDKLDAFELLADVHDDAALGEYYAECCCIFHNVPDSIQRYFDFESYGRDIRLESTLSFTSYGAVIDNR